MSQAISAFWACSRFSASSQTIGLRAVNDARGDLVAPVRRQAVKHDGVRRRELHRRFVHGVVAEQLQPGFLLGLLAHGHPGVGGDDVGTLAAPPRRPW